VPVPPTPTPAETFASILWCLAQAVVTRTAFGLSQPLINLIITRIRDAKQAFARLAARIQAAEPARQKIRLAAAAGARGSGVWRAAR